MGISS
jgi:protein phosphatase PTC2/3